MHISSLKIVELKLDFETILYRGKILTIKFLNVGSNFDKQVMSWISCIICTVLRNWRWVFVVMCEFRHYKQRQNNNNILF